MIKKMLMLLLVVFTAAGMKGQEWPDASMLHPLSLNPKVKTGQLDNGLTYYILHNEEPQGKANFYIAQKVGSTQEEPSQLGLAHFLEHMAFNGLQHYPGKSMLDYLQLKGIRFGYDINAGTGYDQTVYNINNVTTSDKALMDSVLLVLYDWSCGILLEDSEIEAERGVIREEMRMSEDAMQRMLNKISPVIFPDYAYQHPIIGTEDIIMNFKPETIKAYYKKWYRPDLQGIVIVGDFDADEMETKVKELFSQIPLPENRAERVYPAFTPNEQPIYAYYNDPEMKVSIGYIFFNSEPVPRPIRNTMEMYIEEEVIKQLMELLFNQRLTEFGETADCSYSSATASFGDFIVSKAATSFSIQVIAKNGKSIDEAISDAMAVVARACKNGFTASEYDRVKDSMLSYLDKLYNERDKTNNNSLGRELCNFFLDNTPAPGIVMEYNIWRQITGFMSVEDVNEYVANLLTPENMVVVVAEPTKDGLVVASQEVILGTIQNAMDADYEAYEDTGIDEPMIAVLPQPGKVVEKVEDAALGTTTYTLSNGVKVIMKPTDFSADEIRFSLYKKGGLRVYPADEAASVLAMEDVFDNAKLGAYDKTNLRKYLAGKHVSYSFDEGKTSDAIRGNSTVKDLQTAMELIYVIFTNLQPDETTFNISMDKLKGYLVNLESSPEYIFSVRSENAIYANNPMMQEPSIKLLEQVDYNKSFGYVKNVFSNAAPFTFNFVGNIDEATLVPLLEQYIATLPTSKVEECPVLTRIEFAKGQVNDFWKQPMQTPTTYIKNLYSGTNLPYTAKDYIMTSMVGDLVQAIYLETLREDESGTYTPHVTAGYNVPNKTWDLEYEVLTDPAKTSLIRERADKELDSVFANGTDADHFNKIKESYLQQYQILIRNNNYWDALLTSCVYYPEVNMLTEYEPTLKSINLEDFNNFLKNLYNGQNRIQVVMEGVAE